MKISHKNNFFQKGIHLISEFLSIKNTKKSIDPVKYTKFEKVMSNNTNKMQIRI